MSKKMSKKTVMPKTIYVYVCDYEKRLGGDGDPIFAAAISLDDIPDDHSGEVVGTYALTRSSVFSVKRELK